MARDVTEKKEKEEKETSKAILSQGSRGNMGNQLVEERRHHAVRYEASSIIR